MLKISNMLGHRLTSVRTYMKKYHQNSVSRRRGSAATGPGEGPGLTPCYYIYILATLPGYKMKLPFLVFKIENRLVCLSV